MQKTSSSSTPVVNTQVQLQEVKVFPPHIPCFPPDILEIIKSTNSSDYTWLGNMFVPPPGVPVFTPSQIRTYFLQRNVLMMGDSTNRRLFGTLRAIINAEDLDDVKVAPLENLTRRRRLQDEQNASLISAASAAKFEAMTKGVPDCGPRALKGRLTCENIIGSSAEEYAASNQHINDHSNDDTASNNQTTSTQRKEAKKQRSKGKDSLTQSLSYVITMFYGTLWLKIKEGKC